MVCVVGCGRGSPKGESDAQTPPPPADAAAADASVPAREDAGVTPPDPPDTDDGTAFILHTTGRVSLKRGAGQFEPIIGEIWFMPGYRLRVGQRATASVLCGGDLVCELGTGMYERCCTPECGARVALAPPEATGRTEFVARGDLGAGDRRLLAEQEQKIAALGLGETSRSFLRANLYVNWKLEEAAGEVEGLSRRLDRPEVRRQLREAYAPLMRRTGDLFHKLDKRDRAIDRYKKAVEVAPPRPRAGGAAIDGEAARERARAHSRLADVYVESGKKREAVESLTRAREIYRAQGDLDRAAAADRAILKHSDR
jgi:hypothetical protein